MAVDGVFGEGEAGVGLGDAEVLDDLDAGAVGGLDLEVAGGVGGSAAGEEGCGKDQRGVVPTLNLPLDTNEIDGVYRYLADVSISSAMPFSSVGDRGRRGCDQREST